jgi:predicted DNA-binding transcriptional regulator AlpA
MGEELMTEQELARVIKVGRRAIRYRREDVEAWLRKRAE